MKLCKVCEINEAGNHKYVYWQETCKECIGEIIPGHPYSATLEDSNE